MVCVDNKYAGVILHNEYFTELNIGDKLKLAMDKNRIHIFNKEKQVAIRDKKLKENK